MAHTDGFDDDPITTPDGTNIPADDEVEEIDVSELIDAHLEGRAPANDFDTDVPTVIVVQPVCPGCGGYQHRLEDTDQPPASHAEAWRRGPLGADGVPAWEEGACRGNATWYWCRESSEHGYVGTLVIISKPIEGGMAVFFFPDRRIEARPVQTDRRQPPRGTPK